MKLNKKDYINLLLLNIIFIVVIFIILEGKYLYISKMDYLYQYINISEYFRNLFYNTKNIFPDFAFNISSGVNIYYLSYYGFLSPYILFSYLLPFISMQNYLIFTSILMTIASTNLFYKFLRNNNISQDASFITSCLFLFAVPIIFHSKRHIMFVNYMPFLILSLIYIDNYFKTKKISPIIITTTLIIFSSYLYSVSCIAVIVIYFIYKCTINTKLKIKSLLPIIITIAVAVLISCILILPTFNTLLEGRGNSNIGLLKLLIPEIIPKYMLYNGYGMGLTSISLLALISGLFSKKTRLLSSILIIFITIPICTYILNGGLYINAKPLIPFIPLGLYLTAIFLSNIKEKKINKTALIVTILLSIYFLCFSDLSKLFIFDMCLTLLFVLIYFKYNKYILYIILILISSAAFILYNNTDILLTSVSIDKRVSKLLEKLPDDKTYRTDVLYYELQNINKVYKNHNITTTYSSVEHPDYLEFYYNKFNNAMSYRNFRIIYAGNNYLFQSYMGVKYVVTNKLLGQGYTFIDKYKNLKLYKINNYRSIGYINNNYMSKDEYNKLKYPYNIEALLKYTVVNKNIASNYKTNIKEISSSTIDLSKFSYKLKDSVYTLKFDKTALIEYKTSSDLNNKLLFIRFNMLESNPCSVGDSYITINGMKNKLTCEEWKYHNLNYSFDYVIMNNLDKLNIIFSKGNYKIKDIKIYTLDYSDLIGYNKSINNISIIDKGDYIYAYVYSKGNEYLNLTIPYDKGFVVKINNKKVKYEKINDIFIGVKLNKGLNNIKIEYKAPYKIIATIMSTIGLISLIIIIYKERKKK